MCDPVHPTLYSYTAGVGWAGGASECDPHCSDEGLFWGENFMGVRHAPVKLRDPTKLVYSPHTYGPAVFEME